MSKNGSWIPAILACLAKISIASAQIVAAPGGPASLVPQGSPLPRTVPFTPPNLGPSLRVPAAPATSDLATTRTVRVTTVQFEGASAYDASVLSPLTSGLVGPAVSLKAIDQARLDLLSHYRADGYVLTDVSATVDASGTLRFVVTEGRIADIRLEGDIGPAGTQVLRFLRRLTLEQPITADALERYLLLASDVPGVTVQTVLQPKADEPGAMTLVARVARQAVNGLLAADNRAYRLTGPEQLLTVVDFNSFTSFGERTELSILHSFNNTQTFGQAATEFFIGGSGLRVRLYAGEGTIDPSDPLRSLGYHGTTRVLGGQITYPVIRSRPQTLYVVGALDAIESDIRTSVPVENTRASFDSLRVLRTGVDYALEDFLAGDSRPGINTINVRLSKGLTGLGASSVGSADLGRAGARSDFLKFSGEITRTQTLFRPWDGSTVDLFGLVAGQVSNSVMPAAEKFFLGGIRYNRGYYTGEVSGDNALTTTLELQLNTGFQTEAIGRPLDIKTQFYLFHDWGQTWENRPDNPAQPADPNRRLHSAGGGVRAQLTRYTEFDLEGVARFTRFPQGSSSSAVTPLKSSTGENDSVSPLKAAAFYWRVVTRF